MYFQDNFEENTPLLLCCDYDDGSESSERSKDWDAEPGDERWRMYDEDDRGDD